MTFVRRPVRLATLACWWTLLAFGAARADEKPDPNGVDDPAITGAKPITTTQPVSATGPVAATQPTTAPVAIDAKALLTRLSGDDWKDRQAAVKELVRLGEDADPVVAELLRKPSLDIETRANLEGARKQIDEDRKGGMTYVTLHVKEAHPRDVVAAFAKAAHAPLRPFPDNLFDQGPWANVSIDLDHVPFWEALPQVLVKLGLSLNNWNDGLRLMRGGGGMGQMDGPSMVQGPFLIVANSATRNQSVQFAAGGGAARQQQDQFGVQLSAFVEPKITVLSASHQVNVEEAVDDKGNPLMATGRQSGGYYFGGGGGIWTVFAPLRYPEKNAGQKIARLRGSVTFTVQTESRKIEIADVLHAVESVQVVDGVAVTIKGMRKEEQGGGYELTLSMAQAALQRQSWAQVQQSMTTRLKVLDAAGHALQTRGFSSSGSNDRIDFQLRYASGNNPDGEGEATGPPAKLVWEIPTETKQRKVTFEFKDLPMP